MITPATKGLAQEVAVTLLDGSEASVIGLISTDVIVRFRKNGQVGFTTKAVLPGEFNEIGDGVYLVTFTSGELDNNGAFRVLVTGGSFETWAGDLVVIDDQLSLRDQIISLKAALAGLANVRDVDVLFDVLQLRMNKLEKRASELEKRALILKGQIAALLAK